MDPEDDPAIFPKTLKRVCGNEKMQQGKPPGRFSVRAESMMETSRLGAIEAGAPERIRWIYFESPEWTSAEPLRALRLVAHRSGND